MAAKSKKQARHDKKHAAKGGKQPEQKKHDKKAPEQKEPEAATEQKLVEHKLKTKEEAVALLVKNDVTEADADLYIEEKDGHFIVRLAEVDAEAEEAAEKERIRQKMEDEQQKEMAAAAEQEAKKQADAEKAKSKAEGKKSTKAKGDGKAKGEKSPRVTCSSVARDLIRAGKSNAEVWSVIQKQFNLDDKKKGYPGWYRAELKRKGEKVPESK